MRSDSEEKAVRFFICAIYIIICAIDTHKNYFTGIMAN